MGLQSNSKWKVNGDFGTIQWSCKTFGYLATACQILKSEFLQKHKIAGVQNLVSVWPKFNELWLFFIFAYFSYLLLEVSRWDILTRGCEDPRYFLARNTSPSVLFLVWDLLVSSLDPSHDCWFKKNTWHFLNTKFTFFK